MTKVLITGGAGFIGSHTADELLNRGYEVRVLDLLDPQVHGQRSEFPDYVNPAVDVLRGDVRDPGDVREALQGVDAVFHFAAFTGVGQSMYDLRSYVDTNCTGTATLLEAIVKEAFPISRLVLASSRAVYGEGTHECPVCGFVYPPTRRREDMDRGQFDVLCPTCGSVVRAVATAEDRPLLPCSVYAWTKRHQEDLCHHVSSTHGLPITCLRYFNVYGSRQSLKNPYTGVVSIFYSRLMAGQPISLYEHGKPGRDFVHVSDVARANVLALEADVEPGSCINVGSGVESTILDIANALAETTGRSADLQDRGEFRVGDIHSCYADLTRARRFLGYEPKVSLREGMAEFGRWAQGEDSVDQYQKTVEELESHGLFGRAHPAADGQS